ncbi:MAG: hypothetical protein ABIN18_03515 [Pseudomonadota bacterium]
MELVDQKEQTGIQKIASESLAEYGDDAVDPITEALLGTNSWAMLDLLDVLSDIGTQSAQDSLVVALTQSPNPQVQARAINRLHEGVKGSSLPLTLGIS